MAWPPTPTFVTTSVDAGTDDPAVARAEIKKSMDDLSNVINGRAQASGVASLDAASKIPVAQIPITPISSAAPVVLTVGSGTWTVPAGVTRIKTTVVGGGGGGGYTSVGTGGDHGGGGGASGPSIKHFTVVPGDIFNYTVGAKGVGWSTVASDGNGTNGGNSTLLSPGTSTPAAYTVTSPGGLGGLGPAGSRFGGGGSKGVNGDIVLWGGAGISGASRGGGGGSNMMSGAAAGATGYGGGGGFGSGGGTPAMDGLDGFIIIEY